jgi:Uma2 family endonuclease
LNRLTASVKSATILTISPGRHRLTYHEYLLTPEDRLYELIAGELHMTPAPLTFHQTIAKRLFRALDRFVDRTGLGEVFFAPCDVYFSRWDVVQPDVLFIASMRLGIVKERCIEGAPDLVVEILSPATAERDRALKLPLYSRHGVQECWLVDPQGRSVEIYVRCDAELQLGRTYREDDDLESPLLARFSFSLAGLFAPLATK